MVNDMTEYAASQKLVDLYLDMAHRTVQDFLRMAQILERANMPTDARFAIERANEWSRAVRIILDARTH